MKIKNITERGIEFDNGQTIEGYHSQDCCENVYVDWEQLKDTDIMSHEFSNDLKIEKVEDSGFRLEGYFIPCYNSQNGYYSNYLSLIIKTNEGSKEIDISDCVEDDID